jgi:hypothetical protein
VNVAKPALRHGIDPGDAILASKRFIVSYRVGRDPLAELRLGFDSKVRLLETVVIANAEGTEIVIHAMRARAALLDLLPGGDTL